MPACQAEAWGGRIQLQLTDVRRTQLAVYEEVPQAFPSRFLFLSKPLLACRLVTDIKESRNNTLGQKFIVKKAPGQEVWCFKGTQMSPI